MGNLKKLTEAIDILNSYTGNNPYILMLKRKYETNKKLDIIGDFQVEYVLKNKDFTPKLINKITRLADWYAEKKKEDWGLEFLPIKIKVIELIGETSTTYHCYVKYRQSVDPVMCFIPKKAILRNFLVDDYRNMNIDFNRYDRISSEKDNGRRLLEHQKEGVKFLLSRKKCILADDQGTGKMEPVDSLIPTPKGFVRMGDIDIYENNVVFDQYGKPTLVLKTFFHKNKDIYKVFFDDGTTRECGLEHLWKVSENYGKWKTLSLKEIMDIGIKNKNGKNKFRIPVCCPVIYEERNLSIQPYELGKEIGEKYINKKYEHNYNKLDSSTSNFAKYLIPWSYRISSIGQRIDLLKGIVESNGIELDENETIHLYTDLADLASSISEIVFSLGGICKVTEKCGNGASNYEMLISLEGGEKYIEKVEYSRKSDAKCLMVSSDDHTYLTGTNYIVTHNTTTLTVAAIEGNYDSVVIICPASLKNNWAKELKWYVPSRDITILESFTGKTKKELEVFLGYPEGKSNKKREELLEEAKEKGKWESNRFVILNYDILDDFFKIPKTRSKDNLNDSFRNSPLLRYIYNRKSLIIIDEAHKLSNSTSNRYKIIKNLIKYGNPDSLFLATGTPITNNPQNLFCLLQLLGDEITDDWDYYMKRYCDAKEIVSPKDKEKRDMISNSYIAGKGKSTWFALNDKEKEELRNLIKKKCRMMTIAQGSSNIEELRDRISHIYLRRMKEDVTNLPNKIIHEVRYDLNERQKAEYNKLWAEYEEAKRIENPDIELNKDLLEGGIYRRYLALEMVQNTVKLTEKLLNNEPDCKVVIFCCFDDEIYALKEYFGDMSVLHNGKMNAKQKDKAVYDFQNDEKIKVFLGNCASAGVGITLIRGNKLIFNDFDYTPSVCRQCEDRVHRIGQTKQCDIYYQFFNDTQYENMWNIVMKKAFTIDQIIKKEKEK